MLKSGTRRQTDGDGDGFFCAGRASQNLPADAPQGWNNPGGCHLLLTVDNTAASGNIWGI